MSRTRASIRDVARDAGVSLTTVSLVLNKNDARISETTRRKVLETIDRLEYTPSRLARGLPNRQAKTLAVLVPALQNAFADAYFGEIISGIYEQAADRGFRILLEVARREYVRRREYLRLLDDCSVDGLLFIGATLEHRWLQEFDGDSRPLLIVNNHFEQWDLHHVECDYAAAGRLAAEHLLEHGHRRIGHICGPTDVVCTAADVTEAFTHRLAEGGVRLSDQLIVEGKYQAEFGRLACLELLERDPDLTAIFASNDKMALGAYQALRASGRTPGVDVSVIGCDDIPAASLAEPSLTTVRLNFFNVGQRSCQRLIDLIGKSADDGVAPRVREHTPVQLVERSSVHRVEPSSPA